MIFRCKRCQSAVWYGTDRSREHAVVVRCRDCGQAYDLGMPSEIRLTSRRLAPRARSLAAEVGIDLPGAYSVLLGLMTERQARSPAPIRDLSTPEASVGRVLVPPGVPWQEARRVREGDDAEPLRVRCPAQRPRRPLWFAAALALLAAILALTVSRDGGSAREDGERAGPTEARTDADGRVLQVVGPDPISVLRSYCVSGADHGRFQALAVIPTSTGPGRARLGLLRDPATPANLLAITIQEDREKGRWFAGDGLVPVIAHPAPPDAEKRVKRLRKFH